MWAARFHRWSLNPPAPETASSRRRRPKRPPGRPVQEDVFSSVGSFRAGASVAPVHEVEAARLHPPGRVRGRAAFTPVQRMGPTSATPDFTPTSLPCEKKPTTSATFSAPGPLSRTACGTFATAEWSAQRGQRALCFGKAGSPRAQEPNVLVQPASPPFPGPRTRPVRSTILVPPLICA